MKGRSKFSQGLSKELLNSPVIVRNAEGGREIGEFNNSLDRPCENLRSIPPQHPVTIFE